MSILAAAAGLLGILGIHFHCLCKCFFIGNLGRTHICLHLKLTQQTIHNDLQMQLAHAGDNGLACLRIGVGTESRILLRKLCKSLAHFALSSLCLGLDSQLDNGLGEFHGLKNHRMLLVTDGITCGGKLKAHSRRNVA